MAKTKIKTRKTLKKRLRITKRGKLLKKQTCIGHLKGKWSANHKHRKNKTESQPNAGHIKIFRDLLGK